MTHAAGHRPALVPAVLLFALLTVAALMLLPL